jgi:D-alanyl-D-alanine dipeptidase
MKRPVSVIRPMYSASATAGVGRDAEPVHQIPDDLGRAGGVGDDVVERAEAGVVVVVVDVQQVRAVAQHARGVAVDVAAVEEHDGALGDVGGRLLDQAVEGEEAVLARQRQVVRAR